MEPVKVAIVGIGWWSGNHASALRKTELLKLVTCYTRTKEKATKFAAENNCQYEDSYEAMLRRKDVDAIILTTPHTTHPELAMKAAHAGKHLLIEKPLANTVEECQKIVNTFEKEGLTLSVCQDRRWTGYHRKMKELIENGSVGTIPFGEANYFHGLGLNLTPDSWRWYKRESPGGPMGYLGIHMIDTLRFLIDPSVDEVQGTMARMLTKAEIDDTVLCNLKFKNGSYGFVGSIFTVPRTSFVNIYGTEMNLYSGERTGLLIQRKGTEEREKVEFDEVDPIQKEQEDFAISIRERRRPEVDGYEGMRNVAVIEALVRSAKKRRPVKLSEVLSE